MNLKDLTSPDAATLTLSQMMELSVEKIADYASEDTIANSCDVQWCSDFLGTESDVSGSSGGDSYIQALHTFTVATYLNENKQGLTSLQKGLPLFAHAAVHGHPLWRTAALKTFNRIRKYVEEMRANVEKYGYKNQQAYVDPPECRVSDEWQYSTMRVCPAIIIKDSMPVRVKDKKEEEKKAYGD